MNDRRVGKGSSTLKTPLHGAAGKFLHSLVMPREKQDPGGDAAERSIWPPYEVFYIQSMLFSSESAARSIEDFNAVMHVVFENSPENPLGALPVHHVLTHLQTSDISNVFLS